MFFRIFRPFSRFSSSRVTPQGSIPDVSDPCFWEEESRPIPNTGDSVLHVVTQENQHINWERSHEKVTLVGEVAGGVREMSIGIGRATHFLLKTTTVVEEKVDYRVLEQFHYVVVMQETLRQFFLSKLRDGTPMMIVAGINYRFREDKENLNVKFIPLLFLETFTFIA
eukprot:TRINITY_DN22489_c0_g1_i1.p1 TRINITY_DN22489_c0_g1~~TRINITY_DN22489_c0_g1_i1.p1  ORF type:complete len:168 (-),score=19.36 TRINITY_DN22489_c0_g1_i1:117-620(-)